MATTETAQQPYGMSHTDSSSASSFESHKSSKSHPPRSRVLRATPKLTKMPDRPGKRRPFSTWMKKLTNFKGGSSTDSTHNTNGKKNTHQLKANGKKAIPSKNNNPYPESGLTNGLSVAPVNGRRSFSTVPTGYTTSDPSLDRSRHSAGISEYEGAPPTIGNKSTATKSTDVAHSDAAPSNGAASSADGNTTMGQSGRGNDSTFSSPAPSIRSVTTTLTTIHSANAQPITTSHSTSNGNAYNPSNIQFTHQFPASPPPTALPAHLAPHGSGGHPATYSTATANNLLTDNASILTLASSSKRRRRRSMDTDASVRALAPSSLFGGSRESLPLSVLSATIEPMPTPHQTRPSVGGMNERASMYSAAGIAPALPSERNSYYAGKQSTTADGGSVKSGFLEHGRNGSISGSIGGIAAPSSPLASLRDGGAATMGRLSRTNSGCEDGEKDAEKQDIETDREEEVESKA